MSQILEMLAKGCDPSLQLSPLSWILLDETYPLKRRRIIFGPSPVQWFAVSGSIWLPSSKCLEGGGLLELLTGTGNLFNYVGFICPLLGGHRYVFAWVLITELSWATAAMCPGYSCELSGWCRASDITIQEWPHAGCTLVKPAMEAVKAVKAVKAVRTRRRVLLRGTDKL